MLTINILFLIIICYFDSKFFLQSNKSGKKHLICRETDISVFFARNNKNCSVAPILTRILLKNLELERYIPYCLLFFLTPFRERTVWWVTNFTRKKENEGKRAFKKETERESEARRYVPASRARRREEKEGAKREFRVIIGHWPSVSLHLRRRIPLDREI